MKILVNEKSIDFTLENESKLGDVIRNLEKWIAQNDNVIRSVRVNNKDLNLENFNNDVNDNESNMKIEEIKTVEIVTSNKIDLAFDAMSTIDEFRNNILRIFETGIEEIIKRNDEVLEGIGLIIEALQLSLKILNINAEVVINSRNERLENILSELNKIKKEYERKYLDEKAVESISSVMNRMDEYIVKIYKWGIVKNYPKLKLDTTGEIPFIAEILKDIFSVCKDTEKKFEDIGTNIQVGEDLKAYQGIYSLVGIINEIIDLFKVIKGEIYINDKDLLENFGIEGIFGKITKYLKEVEESFYNEDLITIADVIEYELKPLFKKLTESIKEIGIFIEIN